MSGQHKPFSTNSDVEAERLEMALDAASVGTWELDLFDNTVRWCHRTKTLYGFSGDDIVPYEQVLSLIHPDDKKRVEEDLKLALDSSVRKPYNIEFRVTTDTDNQSKWLLCKGLAYFNEKGQPERFLGTAQNVSQDVQNRQLLRENEEKTKTLLNHTPDLITRWNKDLKLIFANTAFEKKGGIPNEFLVGKTCKEINQADFILEPAHLKEIFETGKQGEYYNTYPTENGEISVHLRLIPELNEDGGVESVLAIARDITDIKSGETRFQTMVEQSPMAIGLLRGRDLIIEIGNDKIFELWGKDKSVLGKTILEALPEIKDQGFIELLHHVYDTGEPFFGNSILAKLINNGVVEDKYFDFAYTPLLDKSNTISGVIILATEVTAQVIAKKAVEFSEAKFRLLIEEAPVATCLLVGREFLVEVANEEIIQFWGKDKSVLGKRLMDAVPELIGQPFLGILDQVYTTGKTYVGKSEPAHFMVNGKINTSYFDYTFKPLRNAAGEIYAILDMAVDVTSEVLARQALEDSESKLRSVIAAAPAGMVVFTGRDLIVEMPNQAFIEIIGKDAGIAGKPLREAMPELQNQAFLKILDEVFTSGKVFKTEGTQVDILKRGVMTHNLYDFTYTPILDKNGKVVAILDVSVDVTESVNARRQLEESELFSRSVIDNSPIAKFVLIGEEMKIRTANDVMLEIVGKDKSIRGKVLLDAIPELAHTPIMERLQHVYQTGEVFHNPEEKIEFIRFGKPYSGYYNHIYKPLSDANGVRYGIIVTFIEITEQVVARQKAIEAEESLRDAVELAELGTWILNPASGTVTHSERMRKWFGFEKENLSLEEAMSVMDETDRLRVQESVDRALADNSNGYFAEEYVVTSHNTGQRRILQARGRAFFNQEGKAYLMRGTAQDVTEQRLLQLGLEQQVQERTEELEVSNEELAAINEEYMATNEELAESNYLLTQSNQNLQQFAYIASHDLQEPLRKIQSFGNLLSNRYAKELGEGTHLVERMQTAANRMSVLIQDLLTFSRISTKQDNIETVSLSRVIDTVLSDLELKIQETGATINVSQLPLILGDESQLGQLFQNLISNALKFRLPNVAPIIEITADSIYSYQLPAHVKPAKAAASYYRIKVSDNGIGFDQKYADRIFQVFQRLHGRSEFAGTGIGLAICEKVASNHGGAIAATSQPGNGAVFTIYLPEQV
ncbi:PAS domain-containing protein [Dyadobacter sp. CY356]|uniref:PAS domain-containing sensor histidine kinase n=1 Tax=Dyadobacter sp. CY356 TaxID=2906442 RepID=UPI001F34BB8E|nr:PAS domain-containing protein [Dyadobacter sp. CY356]MCF0054863.1 PAS domain-containing protein [Dyadobacter sp. CY356]